MHAICVEDPWFGSYQKVFLGGYRPDVVIGPLFQRSIQREYLKNYGTVVERNEVREKNCEHYYVSGLVSGSIPSNQQPAGGVVLTGPRDASFTRTRNIVGSSIYEQYDVEQAFSGNPSSGTSTVSFRVRRRYFEYGKCKLDVVGGCTFSLKTTYDPYRKTTSYTAVNGSVIGWGDMKYTVYLASVACPLSGQDGIDNGLGALNQVEPWIDMALSGCSGPNGGDLARLRDEALYRSLEGSELVNINWLTDLKEWSEPLSTAMQLGNFFKLNPDKLAVVKKIANFHLFMEYVIKTNIMTAEEFLKLVRFLRSGYQAVIDTITSDTISHGTATGDYVGKYGTCHTTVTAKTVLGSGWGAFDSLAKLHVLGLVPGIGDVWDAVPYSFVVDWCIPVQATIDKVQALADVVSIPLVYSVIGIKSVRHATADFQAGSHRFHVNIESVDYTRTVQHSLPSDMSFGSTASKDPRKHSFTGGALVVQRFL